MNNRQNKYRATTTSQLRAVDRFKGANKVWTEDKCQRRRHMKHHLHTRSHTHAHVYNHTTLLSQLTVESYAKVEILLQRHTMGQSIYSKTTRIVHIVINDTNFSLSPSLLHTCSFETNTF